ncbi:MAG: hypothetical protein IMZ71_04645 [Chloroflexi bacterium]|nr:hypothetical protein [Chloroflexota bacterium]
MNAEIYYFSGSGNSLAVARDLATKRMGKLTSIPSLLKRDFHMAELQSCNQPKHKVAISRACHVNEQTSVFAKIALRQFTSRNRRRK